MQQIWHPFRILSGLGALSSSEKQLWCLDVSFSAVSFFPYSLFFLLLLAYICLYWAWMVRHWLLRLAVLIQLAWIHLDITRTTRWHQRSRRRSPMFYFWDSLSKQVILYVFPTTPHIWHNSLHSEVFLWEYLGDLHVLMKIFHHIF